MSRRYPKRDARKQTKPRGNVPGLADWRKLAPPPKQEPKR